MITLWVFGVCDCLSLGFHEGNWREAEREGGGKKIFTDLTHAAVKNTVMHTSEKCKRKKISFILTA